MAKSDAQPANGNPPLPQEVVWHRPASDHRPVVTAPRLSSGDGRAEFTATLEPEALGKMDVHVTVRDGAVRVALAPERPAVAQVVEAQLPQLRSALEHQGLHLASLDVNGSALAAAGRDTRQRHGRDPAQPERARTREVEAVGGTHSRRAEAKATGPLGLDVRV